MSSTDTGLMPINDLVGRIASIQKKAQQLARAKPESAHTATNNKEQLPLWPEPVRAVPNGLLRSALFGAIKKGPRRYLEKELMMSIDGVTIRYTGVRLDQGDLDVWVSVLHAMRLHALGCTCRLTSYALLRLMGKTDTGKNRSTLHTRITRLVANAIEVSQGRYSYMGSLIAAAAKDDATQEWVIELNPKLRPLFAADQFTQVEWRVRHALTGQQLAQWLHGFYASHAKPYPIKIDTLHKLCGSEAVELWKFTQTLRRALDAVVDASTTHGDGFNYEIRNNLVHVSKRGSGPQRRNIANKLARTRRRIP